MTKTPKYALNIKTVPGSFVDYTGFAYPAKHAGPATDANLAKHLDLMFKFNELDLAEVESATIVEQATNTIVAEYTAAQG